MKSYIILLTIFLTVIFSNQDLATQVIHTDSTHYKVSSNQTIPQKTRKGKIAKKKLWGILLFVLGITSIVINIVFFIGSITLVNWLLAGLGLVVAVIGDALIRQTEPPTKEEDKINHWFNFGTLLMLFGGLIVFCGLVIALISLMPIPIANTNRFPMLISGGVVAFLGALSLFGGWLLRLKGQKNNSSRFIKTYK